LSSTCKSFENLFKIFPIGVTSKNKLIGACITILSISLCEIRAALRDMHKRMITLAMINTTVPKASEKIIIT
jgi:hypothetical protein